MADEPDRAEAPVDDELDGELDGGLPSDDLLGGEAPIPAEEAAIHLVDSSLGGFDSEVDDPELAAAYEIDPEPER